MKSGLRILIRALEVQFLVPPKWLKQPGRATYAALILTIENLNSLQSCNLRIKSNTGTVFTILAMFESFPSFDTLTKKGIGVIQTSPSLFIILSKLYRKLVTLRRTHI